MVHQHLGEDSKEETPSSAGFTTRIGRAMVLSILDSLPALHARAACGDGSADRNHVTNRGTTEIDQPRYLRSTQINAMVKLEAAAATTGASHPPSPPITAAQALIAPRALNVMAAMFWIRIKRYPGARGRPPGCPAAPGRGQA